MSKTLSSDSPTVDAQDHSSHQASKTLDDERASRGEISLGGKWLWRAGLILVLLLAIVRPWGYQLDLWMTETIGRVSLGVVDLEPWRVVPIPDGENETLSDVVPIPSAYDLVLQEQIERLSNDLIAIEQRLAVVLDDNEENVVGWNDLRGDVDTLRDGVLTLFERLNAEASPSAGNVNGDSVGFRDRSEPTANQTNQQPSVELWQGHERNEENWSEFVILQERVHDLSEDVNLVRGSTALVGLRVAVLEGDVSYEAEWDEWVQSLEVLGRAAPLSAMQTLGRHTNRRILSVADLRSWWQRIALIGTGMNADMNPDECADYRDDHKAMVALSEMERREPQRWWVGMSWRIRDLLGICVIQHEDREVNSKTPDGEELARRDEMIRIFSEDDLEKAMIAAAESDAPGVDDWLVEATATQSVLAALEALDRWWRTEVSGSLS